MKQLLIFALILISFSCSVSKRKYMKGYHVDWYASKSKKEKLPEKTETGHQNQKTVQVSDPALDLQSGTLITAAANHEPDFSILKKSGSSAFFGEPCDVLLLRDGSEVKGKVIEITPTSVKYKACDFLDGPDYVIEKAKVFMITYANGTKEVFKEEAAKPGTSSNSNYRPNQYNTMPVSNGLATASLVMGILGFYPLIFIGGILGVIFGISALNQINNNPEKYISNAKGRATAGIVVGAASILFWIVLILILVMM